MLERLINMKKLNIVLVLGLTAGLFLSGCSPKTTTSSSSSSSSSQTTQASKKKTKSATTTKTDSQTSTSTQTTQATTSQTQASTQQSTTQPNHAEQLAQLKQQYLNQANQLAQQLDATHQQRYSSDSMMDLLQASDAEYQQWDQLLNQIYTSLMQLLPTDKAQQLKQEEINWINEKENKANAIYNQQNNGSLNRLEAMNSRINSTKERCYTLIQQYM